MAWGCARAGWGAQPSAARAQGAFGPQPETQGLDSGWGCMEPQVGLNDPNGSLPAQDIL